MPKTSKPNSEDDVFSVMKEYSQKKNFNISDSQLRYMAEECYLLYESRGWCNARYWPPLAKKWVLNAQTKFGKVTKPTPKVNKGRSVRDIIMEQENEF